MKAFKPFQIKAFIEWLYESDCTPFIMVTVSDTPGVEIPKDQAHEGKVMFNLMKEMVQNFQIKDGWLRFLVEIGTHTQSIAFPVDDVNSIHCLENGWHYVFESEQDQQDSKQDSASFELSYIQGQATAVKPFKKKARLSLVR